MVETISISLFSLLFLSATDTLNSLLGATVLLAYTTRSDMSVSESQRPKNVRRISNREANGSLRLVKMLVAGITLIVCRGINYFHFK